MNEETANLGLTKQREAILRVLRESGNHLTAAEVFQEAKSFADDFFATVYNSLRYLKEAGHISEISFGNGASRFDCLTARHDHAICTKCGKLVDMQVELPKQIVQSAKKLSGFELESIELTLRGVCPECSL